MFPNDPFRLHCIDRRDSSFKFPDLPSREYEPPGRLFKKTHGQMRLRLIRTWSVRDDTLGTLHFRAYKKGYFIPLLHIYYLFVLHPFIMSTITNFQIDDQWVVTADCSDDSGTTHTHSFVFKDYIGCDSEGTLHNAFKGDNVRELYSDTWPLPTITTEGHLTWTHPDKTTVTEAEMSEFMENIHGHFGMTDVAGAILIPKEFTDGFLEQLKVALTDPGDSASASGPVFERAWHKDGKTQIFYVKRAGEETGEYFKVYDVVSQAAVVKISTDTGIPIQDVDIAVFEARTDTYIGAYIGKEVSLNLISGSASIFDFKLGVGASTGFGIKDDSVEAKLLGCGFSFGKRIEISAFGSSFGMNFGRLKWWK